MTFLHATINNLEETILYHQQQVEETQSQLDRIKISQAYGEDAVSSVEEAIENINPEHLELLKEHLLSLFDTEVQTLPVSNSATNTKQPEAEKEFGPLSYYELTGKPDTRPDTFEDLAPNIVYSSSNRAYVGFRDRKEAEKFKDSISEPAMIGDEHTMNGFKYEVKFHCSKEYIQEIANSINSMSDDPIENIEEINSRVLYNHNDKIVYVGMTAKGRSEYYGQYLTGELAIGEKYTVSNKPSFINSEQYKYELRITEVDINDAVHLASFNLQRDPVHPDNKELRDVWSNRKRVHPPAYKPLPKAIALEDVKLGAIVSTSADDIDKKQYKVLAHKELEGVLHVEAICIYHCEMPALVNNCSWFKEVYPVDLMDVRIDPSFSCVEESGARFVPEQEPEEVLTENVQIYVPKKKEEYKPVLSKAKQETLLVQLTAGDAVHRKIGDSIYEVVGMARKDNKMYAECVLISSTNMANNVGNTYFFDNGLYLCEEEPITV